MAVQKRKALNADASKVTVKSVNPTGKEIHTNAAWNEFQKHIMAGISRMIPFLIMGGLILAFSQLIPYVILGVPADQPILDAMNSGDYNNVLGLLKFSQLCSDFGSTLFGFAIPMFAAFVADSIGGKLAFPAGFIGGYVASHPTGIVSLVDGSWTSDTPVASGFIGALLIAFIAGFLVKWLNEKIKVNHNLLAFKSTFLIPLLSAIAVMILMQFVITPLGGAINNGIKALLTASGQAGELVFAAVMSLCTSFDLGGPVNKAAGFVQVGLLTDKVLPTTARCIAIVVPSIGLGLATLIDKKIVGHHVFDRQFYPQGKTAMFLALMGISEGAIPFALEMPSVTIPCYMIGALCGSLTGVALGAVQWFPESAVWAWPLIDGIPQYILGIAVGSLVTALLVIFIRNNMMKKGKLAVDSND
ncbi:MAG: PTS fructose transporter subunit IIC [Solobacterium sp.]|jgi:fructose-specific PTS system IIC-like component|nr:PTS fructose transporter subunit IIC [Solobacterium sp.]MCH4048376.1 PTS fructose transporter subunit IIC [Solobacterium sp.]MCH4074772.1 PTS fructose transporter subunit IIC [Solobacterium sp.]MCI1314782.1 PTS fructose transporter subunit IIC [Solobacterium sp.]MCI1408624.1 PTS fructose transporter subunit IIC [Solobacterium sp.]